MKLNPTEDAQLRQAAQKLHDAERLLGEVRESLFDLYQGIEQSPAPQVQPHHQPQWRPQPQQQVHVDKPAAPAPAYAPVAPAPTPKPVNTEKIVIRLVAAAGVFVTLLGVAFLLWVVWNAVGELGRVVGAWGVALLLFAGAVVVRSNKLAKEGQIAFATASQLASALTVMATVSFLHWWPPLAGAIVLLLLLAFFSAISRLWDSEAMLIVVSVAGFTLFCLYSITGDFFSFPIIAPALFLAVASMQRRWTNARNLAAAMGPVAVILASTDRANELHSFPISLTVLLGVAVFVAVALLDTSDNHADINLSCYSPFAMLVIGGVLAADFLELTILVFCFVAFALLSVLFHGRQASAPLTGLPIVYLFWCSEAPAMGTGQIIERPWLVSLFFLVSAAYAVWLSRNSRFGWAPWASLFVVALIISGELSTSVFARKPLWLTDHVALIQVLTIAVFIGAVLLARRAFRDLPTTGQILIGLGGLHLSSLVVVGLFTYVLGLLGDDGMRLGYLLGHAAVSLLWLLLGAYILIITRALSDRTSLIVGLVLTLASLSKLLLFDMSTLDGFTRFLTFLLEGVILLVIASLRARRTKASQQVPQEPAGMGPRY